MDLISVLFENASEEEKIELNELYLKIKNSQIVDYEIDECFSKADKSKLYLHGFDEND